VLHVCAVRDPTGAYYLGQESAGSVAPARWVGRGAHGLGLRGAVWPAELATTLAGGRRDGGRLVAARRVVAYDLVFTAPKSVSLAAALGDVSARKVVLAAHGVAWTAASDYLADRAAAVRRRDGPDRRLLPIDGLIAAAFTHQQNRAGEPHLHTHLLVANLARGVDGRWSALDARGLFAHARAAGALYGSALRHHLGEQLGIDWRRTRAGQPEIAGVAPELIGGFSSRSAEIRDDLASAGHRSVAARRIAWARTRDGPERARPDGERDESWWRQAGLLGAEGVLELRRTTRPEVAPDVDEHRIAAALDRIDGAPRRRHLVAAWADAVLPGAAASVVLSCVDRFDDRRAVGVGEAPLGSGAVTPVHLLRVLGPRPADPVRLDVWLGAAATVDRYRARWGVTSTAPLGVSDDTELRRLGAARLAEHLSLARGLDETLRRLGRPPVREVHSADRALGLDRR